MKVFRVYEMLENILPCCSFDVNPL